MIRNGHRRPAGSLIYAADTLKFDLIVLNNEFSDYLSKIFLSQLSVRKATKLDHMASYLELTFMLDIHDKLSIKLYDKLDDFDFHIVNFPFFFSDISSDPS